MLGRLDMGGAETMIMNLYRKIDTSRVQFDFVIHTEEECAYSEEVRALGGRIYSMPRFCGSNLFAYISAWKRFFQTYPEYRIVHGHMRSTAAIYLGIAKKFGLVTIAHSHNMSSGSGVLAVVKNLLQLPIRHTAQELFACSVASGQWLYGKKKATGTHFHVLNNAIDTNKFCFEQDVRTQIREEQSVDEQCLVLGHIGRFEEQKNHRFLIDVAAKVIECRQKEGLETRLWLIGEGVLEKAIQAKVAALGIEEQVKFLGIRSDVHAWMQGMDVLVFPSLFEGLPVTLIEAQAAGLAIVASDTVTREVALTKLIKYQSLATEDRDWAACICKTASEYTIENRNEYAGLSAEKLIEAGYDIAETAKWLQEFYCDIF